MLGVVYALDGHDARSRDSRSDFKLVLKENEHMGI
jgi:hypothetical protein